MLPGITSIVGSIANTGSRFVTPTLINVASSNATNTVSMVLPIPSGRAIGDLLIMTVETGSNTVPDIGSSDPEWVFMSLANTTVSPNTWVYGWYKYLERSSAVSLSSVTVAGLDSHGIGVIFAVRDVDRYVIPGAQRSNAAAASSVTSIETTSIPIGSTWTYTVVGQGIDTSTVPQVNTFSHTKASMTKLFEGYTALGDGGGFLLEGGSYLNYDDDSYGTGTITFTMPSSRSYVFVNGYLLPRQSRGTINSTIQLPSTVTTANGTPTVNGASGVTSVSMLTSNTGMVFYIGNSTSKFLRSRYFSIDSSGTFTYSNELTVRSIACQSVDSKPIDSTHALVAWVEAGGGGNVATSTVTWNGTSLSTTSPTIIDGNGGGATTCRIATLISGSGGKYAFAYGDATDALKIRAMTLSGTNPSTVGAATTQDSAGGGAASSPLAMVGTSSTSGILYYCETAALPAVVFMSRFTVSGNTVTLGNGFSLTRLGKAKHLEGAYSGNAWGDDDAMVGFFVSTETTTPTIASSTIDPTVTGSIAYQRSANVNPGSLATGTAVFSRGSSSYDDWIFVGCNPSNTSYVNNAFLTAMTYDKTRPDGSSIPQFSDPIILPTVGGLSSTITSVANGTCAGVPSIITAEYLSNNTLIMRQVLLEMTS